MQRSKTLVAGLIWAAICTAPAVVSAQPVDYAAPVPGPYQALPQPPMQPQPQMQGQPRANPYSNPRFAQPMPYWMQARPQQQTRGNAAAPQGGQAGANAGQPTYIPGWAWSPYAPNSGQARAPGYTPRPGPQSGQRVWPGYPVPVYPNAPRGPAGQYGAPRQPLQ